MPSRSALVITNDTYHDSVLSQLRTPGQDAAALARVLGTPGIGDFEVRIVSNEPEHRVRREIANFFASTTRDDLLLLYFSCHGIKEDGGQLYFATADTELFNLDATAVPASFVNRHITRSGARRVVVLLDCYYTGAFARGLLARAGTSVDIREQFDGRGRIVITASVSMEYILETGPERDTVELSGSAQPSIFTQAIVSGLETGAADLNGDGFISVDEMYDYVFDRVRSVTPTQSPGQWNLDLRGDLVIARSRTASRSIQLHQPELPPTASQASSVVVESELSAAGEDEIPSTIGRGNERRSDATGPGRVFISYRRQETSHLAGRLYDRLADRFGEDRVFMDVDSIEPGLDFSDAIQQAVGSSDVLLALIGRGWLTATDEDGRRRLDDPDDIVRLEIEAALERGIRVIPLLAESATMPRRQDLPDSLAALVRRNAVRLSHESFRHEATRLIDTLAKIPSRTAEPRVELQPRHSASGQTGPQPSQATRHQPSQPPDEASLQERADEQAFHLAMLSIYRQAKRDLGYNASRFLQMLNQGGLTAARQLLHAPGVSEGFTKMWEHQRLDLTVEAHVLKPEFQHLFTPQELDIARSRLREYGYKSP